MISIWCDFIEKSFLQTEFKQLVEKKQIRGATSNPSIFAQALQHESYKEEIQKLKAQDKTPKEIYESLALQDIQLASQILYPMYEENPQNGFISIELDPFLCNDVTASIDEGVRLWHELDSKNVMIKVPATQSGYTIMENLMLRGININATLVFTKEQAQKVLRAFQNANTQAQGVISVFVSRFDREIDSVLPEHLKGKYGIANALEIYKDFKANNTNAQYRILFASTGVKAKSSIYNDDGYYVYPLNFTDCINTLPLETLKNLDYARLQNPQDIHSFASEKIIAEVQDAGVDIVLLEDKLLRNAIKSFEDSFRDMLNFIQKDT